MPKVKVSGVMPFAKRPDRTKGFARSLGGGVGSAIGGAAGLASGLGKWTREAFTEPRDSKQNGAGSAPPKWVWLPWRKRS